MNKQYLIIVFFFFSIFTTGCNKQNSPISEYEAKQLMDSFFTALSTADSTMMEQITSDSFYMYEHEKIWNTDSLLSLMSRTKGRIWEIQDFKLVTDGDIAHFSYYNESKNPLGRSWYESGLIVSTEQGLKLKFMHSTKLYLTQ